MIPAFNEAARLRASIDELVAFVTSSGMAAELLLVDDGSRDATRAIIDGAASREPMVRAVGFERNRGKGAAIALGVSEARGRYVMFLDADLPYPLEAIGQAVEALDGGADLAIGARNLGPGGLRSHSPVRQIASTLFNTVVEGLLGLGIEDTQCGFKAFRRDVARRLFQSRTIDGFGFDVEILLLARLWHLRIAQLPIRPRRSVGSSVDILRHSVQMARDVLLIWLHVRAERYRQTYDPREPSDVERDSDRLH